MPCPRPQDRGCIVAMTPEERRAKDAERKRIARAKAAEARADAIVAQRTGNASAAPTTMRDAVDESLRAMKWLVASDLASQVQARELARAIDELTHAGEETRALSAHRALSRVLSDLGGTPQVRLQRELRSRKRAPEPEGNDERTDSTSPPAGIVSEFKRPAKRGS